MITDELLLSLIDSLQETGDNDEPVNNWNAWRSKHSAELLDLTNMGINFWRANLTDVDFSGINLRHSYFREAILSRANLRNTNLSHGEFCDVNFARAYLDQADLSGTRLRRAIFSECSLDEANFTGAMMDGTIFADVDLSTVKGLETVRCAGPVTIGIDTIYRSQNRIPKKFLERAGIPETMLTYLHSLVVQPIQYNSCFISYSSADEEFASRLYQDLREHDVRSFFAPEDMRTGDKLRLRIDESIHLHDKLLLILSCASMQSQWVEQEVETALEKERRQPNRVVLFPIRIDDAVMHATTGWASLIKNSRHIADFTRWKDYDEYQKQVSKLLNDLKD